MKHTLFFNRSLQLPRSSSFMNCYVSLGRSPGEHGWPRCVSLCPRSILLTRLTARNLILPCCFFSSRSGYLLYRRISHRRVVDCFFPFFVSLGPPGAGRKLF